VDLKGAFGLRLSMTKSRSMRVVLVIFLPYV